MGDRANIKFIEENGGTLFFYTHWHGFEYMKEALRRALSLRERWDDDSYLARIIFCEVVKGADNKTTGFGLSTYETDNENPIIEVNAKNQTVTIGQKTCSFEEFLP